MNLFVSKSNWETKKKVLQKEGTQKQRLLPPYLRIGLKDFYVCELTSFYPQDYHDLSHIIESVESKHSKFVIVSK